MSLHQYINHVSLLIDESGSMANMPVVAVVDKELNRLRDMSVSMNQETRISIYKFSNVPECLVFDMDVCRFQSLAGHWNPHGTTALIDTVLLSIRDSNRIPQLYGDHAFLQYVITDGEENASRTPHKAVAIKNALTSLPSNWTVGILVPNFGSKSVVKQFGYENDSIEIWDSTTRRGFENVGTQFGNVMDIYMHARERGVRGTSGLFTLNSDGLDRNAAKKFLRELPASSYGIFPVHRDSPIREFVEIWTGSPYRLGSAYYQPTKKVKVQDYKNILVQDVKNGRIYEGQHLRQLLGLPDATVEVNPGDHKDWRIFIQSTSVNRKLFAGTFLLVRS